MYVQIVLHPMKGLKNLLGFVVLLSQPDNALSTSSKYVAHEADLMLLLPRIPLIDANGVDPHNSHSIIMPQSS
jgi:hypothetical protein